MIHCFDNCTLVTYLHGKINFATNIRRLCIEKKFDCIAIDLPYAFEADLSLAVGQLPYICASTVDGQLPDSSQPVVYYLPIDPCDATIEAVRQSQQNHIPFFCIGSSQTMYHKPLPPLPDEYALKTLGYDAYMSLLLSTVAALPTDTDEETLLNSRHCAKRIHELRLSYHNILVLIHLRHFIPVMASLQQEKSYNQTFQPQSLPTTQLWYINPDHLYFALGELPFITAQFEAERLDVLAQPVDLIECYKKLFQQTRDDYHTKDEILSLPPKKLQAGLTFLRNLTVMESRLIPSLFDIITAAKGIGGNTFAVRILKSSQYYPYLPIETSLPFLNVSINKLQKSGTSEPQAAINIFKDTEIYWKTISLKPDPSRLQKKKYRYTWNPNGMCSHIPEDRKIENFNSHARTRALAILSEDRVITEKFQSSIKDGIDIRETVRNWFTGNIYVKELPPSRGSIDTVVIIFDEDHDERYPNQATWYAEHTEESTLTFYATDPLSDLIGPGIARCRYGGLSLLFPPRPIPNIFSLVNTAQVSKLSYQLTFGALLHTQEQSIAYISHKKPDFMLKTLAARRKKRIIWIPLCRFSSETMARLSRFHILNGKEIRSFASRFIDE
ncbi:MAG: hypothetical protein JW795_07080 [Chitinivibrionales bacterium]|nr:hypothetical protein [Chitinivibrionales bacterium]